MILSNFHFKDVQRAEQKSREIRGKKAKKKWN